LAFYPHDFFGTEIAIVLLTRIPDTEMSAYRYSIPPFWRIVTLILLDFNGLGFFANTLNVIAVFNTQRLSSSINFEEN